MSTKPRVARDVPCSIGRTVPDHINPHDADARFPAQFEHCRYMICVAALAIRLALGPLLVHQLPAIAAIFSLHIKVNVKDLPSLTELFQSIAKPG